MNAVQLHKQTTHSFHTSIWQRHDEEIVQHNYEQLFQFYYRMRNTAIGRIGMAKCRELQGRFEEAKKLREQAILLQHGYQS